MNYAVNFPSTSLFARGGTLCFLLLALAFAAAASAQGTAIQQPDTATEAAALRGDWSTVSSRLSTGDKAALPATARLLLAHAALALNHNNEAAFLFLSASTNDVVTWRAWSQGLDGRVGNLPMAGYFRADALARSGQPNEAIRELNRVLAGDNKNAMALNARGVLHAALTNYPAALEDFLAATTTCPSLAEAWNNCAALALDAHEGARAALKDATNAIVLSPEYALALYHRGCLRLILRQYEAAEADFLQAGKLAPQLAPWLREAKLYARQRLSSLRENSDGKPGFQVTADSIRIQDIDMRNLQNGWNPPELQRAMEKSQSTHELNLVMNSAKVGANGDPQKLADISRIYGLVKDHHTSELVLTKSEQSASASASLGLKIKGVGGAGVDGSVSVKNTYQAPGALPNYDTKTKMFSDMDKILHNSPKVNPGGFDAGQRDAVADSGDWPYVPIYALAYSKSLLPAHLTPPTPATQR